MSSVIGVELEKDDGKSSDTPPLTGLGSDEMSSNVPVDEGAGVATKCETSLISHMHSAVSKSICN